MNVIFMGTPDFAVETLKALLDSSHRVAAVVTQPDRQKGRGHQVQFSPVKEVAVAHGIDVIQPDRIRDAQWMDVLAAYQPDVMAVVAFGQILPVPLLELPPFGCVNVHASLLPRYRGAAPIQQAILDGEKETGVTVQQMNEGVDTGDILMQRTVEIAPEETGGSQFDKLAGVGAELLVETLDGLEKGTITPAPQPAEGVSYVGKLTKEMGDMDWNRPAAELERLVRGLDPWPGAYTRRGGKTLKIWKTKVTEPGSLPDTAEQYRPGQIAYTDKRTMAVAAGDGYLSVLRLQPEGKKIMDIDAYLRGYPVKAGEQLGK